MCACVWWRTAQARLGFAFAASGVLARVRVCACVCVRVCGGGQHRHVSVLRLLPLVQALCAAPGEQGAERSKSQALPSPLRAPVLRR